MIRRLFIALALAAASFGAFALTPAQLQTLKAAILAETTPAFVAFRAAGDKFSMAAWYNGASTTVVWKTSVSKAEIIQSPAFDWTRVDNLSVGKARIWDEMFSVGNINSASANIRAGIDATWVGTQADLNVRAAVYAACKRFASRVEKLFVAGTGTDASPAVLTFEGNVSSSDIGEALEQ